MYFERERERRPLVSPTEVTVEVSCHPWPIASALKKGLRIPLPYATALRETLSYAREDHYPVCC